MDEPPVDRVPRGRGIFRRFRSGGTPESQDVPGDQAGVSASEVPTEPGASDSGVVLHEERTDGPDDVSKNVEDNTTPDTTPSMERTEMQPPPGKLRTPPQPPGPGDQDAASEAQGSKQTATRHRPATAVPEAEPSRPADGVETAGAASSARSPTHDPGQSLEAPTPPKKARRGTKGNDQLATADTARDVQSAGTSQSEESADSRSSSPTHPVAARPTVAEDRPVPATEPVETGDRQEPETGALAEAPAEDEADEVAHSLPRVFAIANQKGGVGKTTTAVNLGAALAELGYRVLVIDLDPQGNATTGLGINARNLELSVYDVIMHETSVEDCIEPTSLRNLFLVPATINLAGSEVELVPMFSRELRLRRALEGADQDFDFTLIDCPPSLGLLTVNGLAAASEVLVPIQCEYYALEGLGQLLRNVELVRVNLNPTLDLSTIILTMFDARTKLSDEVAMEIRKHFGDKVCRSIVPRTVRLSEAPSFGQPIILFDSSSRGALAYRELAKEVSGGASQRVG